MSLEELAEELFGGLPHRKKPNRKRYIPQPVHVFYGGADLFKEDTIEKLGRLALASIDKYAPDAISFAKALWLPVADSLPLYEGTANEVLELLESDPHAAESAYPGIGNAARVFAKTKEKLETYPVEQFRIDFEDGYGFRNDEEEDLDAAESARRLASVLSRTSVTDSSQDHTGFGFRIKSFAPETRSRSIRTLDIFLRALSENWTGGNGVSIAVALPKIESASEIEVLSILLDAAEQQSGLPSGTFRIEVVIETPSALENLSKIAGCETERLDSAHFGAYDYTSLLGISSDRQHLNHPVCDYARMQMLNYFSERGIPVCDSVTTVMPVPVHRSGKLEKWQEKENIDAVHGGWRTHFRNVTLSMANGFYQSWDLHPAQLVARYAAVYTFYFEARNQQLARLNSFLEKATKASLTGNEFDDAASAEGLLNFVRKGCAAGAFDAENIAGTLGLEVDQLLTARFSELAAIKAAVQE